MRKKNVVQFESILLLAFSPASPDTNRPAILHVILPVVQEKKKSRLPFSEVSSEGEPIDRSPSFPDIG